MESERNTKIPRELFIQILLIGISAMGIAIFFYFEGGFFNSYITHVLELDNFFVAVLVSLSAMMGLIFVFTFGIFSDNTRTDIGRRRPFLLFGVVAGVAMILYSFSPEFIWCIIFDVVIIGVFINANLAAHKALIPDVIDLEFRGRANAIIGIFEVIAQAFPLAMTLLVYEAFGTRSSDGSIIVNQQGHFFLLLSGGMAVIICSTIAFLFIREKQFGEDLPPKKTFKQEIQTTFKFSELKKYPEFFKFILGSTVYNIGTKIITVFLFIYIFDLGLPTIELVLAILILAPTVIGATIFLGKIADNHGRKKAVAPVLILGSIGGILMPFGGTRGNLNTPLLLIGAILLLIGTMSLMVPIKSWEQDLLPEDKRGQFIGILNLTTTINQIPASFLAALVADAFGVHWIFALIPFFFIGALPLFLRVNETLPEKEE